MTDLPPEVVDALYRAAVARGLNLTRADCAALAEAAVAAAERAQP